MILSKAPDRFSVEPYAETFPASLKQSWTAQCMGHNVDGCILMTSKVTSTGVVDAQLVKGYKGKNFFEG